MASRCSVAQGLVPTSETVSHCPSVVSNPLTTENGHWGAVHRSPPGVQEVEDEATCLVSDCPPEIVAVAVLVGVRSRVPTATGLGPPPSVIVSSPFCSASVTVVSPPSNPPEVPTSSTSLEHWV